MKMVRFYFLRKNRRVAEHPPYGEVKESIEHRVGALSPIAENGGQGNRERTRLRREPAKNSQS